MVQSALSKERWAVRAPFLLIGYFAVLLAIRLLSPNVEIDEAHFYDQQYWALGYGGSHPPLYAWLVHGLREATGLSFVTAVAAVKFALNALAWILMYLLVRDVSGRDAPALAAVCVFALMPQIVWQAQVTLAHSVLVFTASVALLYALHLAMTRGRWRDYVLLAIAAAAGLMAKYNFGLFLLTIAIAVTSLAGARARINGPKMLVGFALFVLLCLPHFAWALDHWQETTQRMQRMYTRPTAFDVPVVGIDGFVGFVIALVASTAPAWLAALWAAGPAGLRRRLSLQTTSDTGYGANLYGRMLAIGLGAIAIAILAADVHSIAARYLIPNLVPFAPWLALKLTGDGDQQVTRRFLAVGGAVLVLLPVAYVLRTTSGRDRLTVPYASIAKQAAEAFGSDFAIATRRDVTAVNIAMHLGKQPVPRMPAARVVVAARIPKDKAWLETTETKLAKCGYRSAGQPVELRARHGLIGARQTHFKLLAFDAVAGMKSTREAQACQ